MTTTIPCMARLLPLVLATPLLTACLQPMTDFPSLARRDVELRDRMAEAKAPPPSVEAITDPALANVLMPLLARADAAEAEFASARAAAQQAAGTAREAPVGSEAWSVAQTRISALDAPRRELAQLLGDIEALYIARLDEEAGGKARPGGSAQIDQARAHVVALIASQEATISALKAGLAS